MTYHEGKEKVHGLALDEAKGKTILARAAQWYVSSNLHVHYYICFSNSQNMLDGVQQPFLYSSGIPRRGTLHDSQPVPGTQLLPPGLPRGLSHGSCPCTAAVDNFHL